MAVLWFLLGALVTVGLMVLLCAMYKVGVKEGEKHVREVTTDGSTVGDPEHSD